MKKFAAFLNGGKTIIGAILTSLCGFLYAKGIIDELTSGFILSVTGSVMLLIIGTWHKVSKYKAKKNK